MSKQSTQVSLKTKKNSRLEDILYLPTAWYSMQRFVYNFSLQKTLGKRFHRLCYLFSYYLHKFIACSTNGLCRLQATTVNTPRDGPRILRCTMQYVFSIGLPKYLNIQLRYQNCVLPKTQIEEFKIIYAYIHMVNIYIYLYTQVI